MKRTIYKVVMALAIILAIGTEGACKMNIIGFGQTAIQEVIAILCIFGSYKLIKLEEDRYYNKVVH